MDIAFAGTPPFAATALDALARAGHRVRLVLTQPDRPAGRGLKLQASPVKQWALAHSVDVIQPRSLRLDGRFADDAAAAQAALQAVAPDVMVVAAYGLILPPWVLALPRHGCLNIHGSLLPRWRGAAPIQRAIEAGDAHTGITIMQMDAGLDTGAMALWQAVPIAAHDTAATLHDTLAALGAELIVQALARLPAGLAFTPQPEAGVTYAHKIDKAEAAIDWRLRAAVIERRVRAFDPFPGASFMWQGEAVKLWTSAVCADFAGNAALPGTVLDAGPGRLVVACGDGTALECLEVQRPGGRRGPVAAWLASPAAAALRAGAVLAGAPATAAPPAA